MKPGHSAASHASSSRGKSDGSSHLAAIACWVVLLLVALPADQAHGAGMTAKAGLAQSSPILEQPVIQGSRTPTAGSGEPVPRLPDPSVTRTVTIQPIVSGVSPSLLSPGKGYILILQGQALTQQMTLDFGPGITTVVGSVKIGTGPEGMASVQVQVAPDAVPGMRTVKLAGAPGQPWQVQPAKLAVFVEPVPKAQGPLRATPLK